MSFWGRNEDANKKRLWNDILVQTYGTSDLSVLSNLPPDPEGFAFFLAIDKAFTSCDKMKGCVPVDRELVQYLAGWGRDTIQGYDQHGGPLGSPRHNHFVKRAFDGFINTLQRAVRHNQLRYYDSDRTMYGCFVVPSWFIDMCMDELRDEADHVNAFWDKDPESIRRVFAADTVKSYWM